MTSRLSSFDGMPEEEFVAAFAELVKLCDITSAFHAKKADKRIDSKSMATPAIIRQHSIPELEECEANQPPSRYIRKTKAKVSHNEDF
jgi:hypothetical protein